MGPCCCRKLTPAHHYSLPLPPGIFLPVPAGGGGTLSWNMAPEHEGQSPTFWILFSRVWSHHPFPVHASCIEILVQSLHPGVREWWVQVTVWRCPRQPSSALVIVLTKGTGSVMRFMCWLMALCVFTVWLKLVVMNVCTHRDRQTDTPPPKKKLMDAHFQTAETVSKQRQAWRSPVLAKAMHQPKTCPLVHFTNISAGKLCNRDRMYASCD